MYEVNLTIQTANEEAGQRIIEVLERQAGAEVQIQSETASGSVGQVIFAPKKTFADADTEVRAVRMSEQDSEVCDKAVAVLLNWWEAGAGIALLPAEGDPEQLRIFPFQRLALLAERYEEAE
jgi:hypothetical protein